MAADTAAAGDAKKGKEVFDQCSACHSAETDEKRMGPALKGLFKREKLRNGQKVTDDSVRAIINKGGRGMPGYANTLSDEERNDLLTYLHTL